MSNLIDIYSILIETKPEDVVNKAQSGKWGIGDFKNELINEVWKVLNELQTKMKGLDDKAVKKVIEEGADKARL